MSYHYPVAKLLEIISTQEQGSKRLERCIKYDKTSMAGECKHLDELVDQLFSDCDLAKLINAKQPKKVQTATSRIKQTLRSILWFLFIANRYNFYVRIALSTHEFPKCKIRNPHGVAREMSSIIKALNAREFIEYHKGYINRTTGDSKDTRVRAKSALIDRFSGIPHNLDEKYVVPPPIEFRAKEDECSKKKKRYKFVTHEHRDQSLLDAEAIIQKFNEIIKNSSITLQDHDDDFLSYSDQKIAVSGSAVTLFSGSSRA